MKTARKVLMSVLLSAVCVLAVVVWAEANSTTMFGPADLREARNTMETATEKADRISNSAEKDIIRLFEREVKMARTTYATAKFCGVAIVILSTLCMVALWVPPEQKKLNQPPMQTPAADAPVSPSLGAAGR
jgi:hypothetical protein